ncbi:type IV inositol polyphosphate 5-phosphatase 9 [Ziziphus jujuba]|uniref:Type IV inositol polyphosphate 5-phosphatase 9 n=1 Tax=Ziziphus jujuba TaxID=326968 RepID=A0ABM3ZYW9_ZIZJJ|nr:type IV inositol polyphosphate 5-phosphatase 9 [Ziziphus jujuba]
MPINQGEIMWPRLVANKVFRKRTGSNNFFADFRTNSDAILEGTSGVVDHDQPYLNTKAIFNPHNHNHKYKVFVSTWNVAGVEPHEDLNLEDWIDPSCDIYVLGFQEIVPLKASNVLGSENSKITMKWNSLIRQVLNNKLHRVKHKEKDQKIQKLQNFFTIKTEKLQDFQCIISKQMVGILISVWVRSDLRPFVHHPSVSCVGCGIMGCLGNKGSVSVRFRLHGTSFCLVCCHLASGGGEGDEKHRNSDVSEIMSRTSFPRVPLLDLPRKILDHDQVILLGDLNYRISLPEETTRLLVDGGEWNVLLENDQLRKELIDGQVLEGWHEGDIKFPPTYKYCPNSDTYFGCVQGRKDEKRRAPAWCDRIIWYGKGLNQHLYTRGELKLSDHRPVKAIFTAEVGVEPIIKGFHQSFFLSERFEQITNKFEVSSTNDFVCKSR